MEVKQKKVIYHLSPENDQNQAMEEWLEQAKREEKIKQADEDNAQDLFDSAPTVKRKRQK